MGLLYITLRDTKSLRYLHLYHEIIIIFYPFILDLWYVLKVEMKNYRIITAALSNVEEVLRLH